MGTEQIVNKRLWNEYMKDLQGSHVYVISQENIGFRSKVIKNSCPVFDGGSFALSVYVMIVGSA